MKSPESVCLLSRSVSCWSAILILLVLSLLAGVAAGQLAINPVSLDFGVVNIGNNLSPSVTLTNKSSATLRVLDIVPVGAGAAGYSVKGPTMPLLLSTGQSATFHVIFAPPLALSFSANVVVVSKASNSPQYVTLTGTGWVPVHSKVPASLFGMDVHPEVLTGQIPWPAIPFGSLRLWDTKTDWASLNPSKNTYDWSNLDDWLQMAKQQGQTDVLYTFGEVPQWASSNPNDQTCADLNTSPGSCDAPYDLNSDGSGPDLLWQNYVTALVNHAAGRIHYWEIWNEPDVPQMWNGTTAQMLRMVKDAYTIIKSIDPTALVTTPTTVNTNNGRTIDHWLPPYLAAGGTAYADIVTFHGYINTGEGHAPEWITNIVDNVTTAVAGTPLSSKPVWNTEGAWTTSSNLTDSDLQAALVARVYLLQWFKGVSRFYWFQYGGGGGPLWTPAGPSKAEIAFSEVYSWLKGAALTGPCVAVGSVWTCTFAKTGGVQQQAVWDASKTCSNGKCTKSSYRPGSVYTQYTDLEGNVTPFSPGTTIPIGAKPILLANQ